MNPLRFAVFAVFLLSSLFATFARAVDECPSETSDIKKSCDASIRYIEEGRQAYTKASAALADRKDLPGIKNARTELAEAVKRLREDGGSNSPVQSSKKCTEAVNRCMSSACAKKDETCKSEGEDKKREDEIKRLEALNKELGKTENDGTAGGKGDGKGDQAKKDEKGGGGGGMPEMPKPPEDKKEENADKSCGGSTPDPSCPPKDDVCFKDPNSVACLCQAGLGTADVCKRAETKSERDKGGTDNDSLGGGGGGKSATYANEKIGADPARGGPRGGGFAGGGGGGRSGGLGGLGAGSGGGGAALPELPSLQKLSDPSSGSGGLGSSGGSRYSPSTKKPKPYEKMLARGMAIVQRRLAGGSAGEIGASHGNLFESVSRAYRLKASSLRK